jgi:TolB-like protein
MLTSFALVLVAAAPTQVASLGFKAVGVDEQKAQFLAGDFAVKLRAASGVAVVTPEEITAALGVERQRQLLGCSDSGSSCLAELAGGLGADLVLQGTVARVGEAWALTVKLVDLKSANIIVARSGQVSRESDVLEWLSQTAQEFGAVLKQPRDASQAPQLRSTVEGGLKRMGWLPAVVGGVFTVSGAILLAVAHTSVGAVAQGDASIASTVALDQSLRQATTLQTLAVVSWAVAAAGWLTAAGFWLFGNSSSGITVSMLASPQTAALVVGGSW